MRLEIPRTHSARRRTSSVALMTELESRTLFSASPTVVHIGPTQAVKSLDAAKWPTKSGQSVKFVVDYSSTPYSLGHHAVFGSVTIEPSDPSHRPTFKLQPTNYPTLYSAGMLTIR